MADVLIELDDRRRASLGKLGRHDRYLAHEEPDGTVVLRPAIILTEMEAALWGNPELLTQIQRSMDNPTVRTRRSGRPQRKG